MTKNLTKLICFFLILCTTSLSYADLSISPAPNSGSISLDSQSSTIYFSNPDSSAISMSLSLSGTGFSLGVDRCSGKNLAPKTSCYIVVNVQDSLLASGSNQATLNNNSSLLLTLSRTKIQNTNPSIFVVTSLSLNDFSIKDVQIKNQTSTTKSYSPVLGGADASKYEISSNRCQNIASGKTCIVSIKLKPQQAGSFSATLTEAQISSGASISSTITNATSGVLPPSVGSVSVSPSTGIDFGTLTKFSPSTVQTLTISNNGNISVTPIIDLSPKMVLSINRCSSALAVGKSCSISVAMNPVYQVDINGVLTGSVSIKATSSSTPIVISATSNLSVPPASVAYNQQGGTCPSNKHFENNVCVNNPVLGHTSCQAIKDETPASPSGMYDILVDGNSVSLYCDMSDPNNAYLEIYDASREPSLTTTQLVQRLNLFTNFPISESNIIRDVNGNFAWAINSSNPSLINGQSIGFEKISASKFKISVYLGDDGQMGQFMLHSSNKTGCIPDTNDSLGCYQTSFKYLSQIRFLMGDFGTNVKNLSYINNGINSNIGSYNVDNEIIDNIPTSIFLTQGGRLESGSPYQNPHFYVKKLLIKGDVIDSSLYPKLSCAAAKSAGTTSSGYIQLDPDGPVGSIQPSWAYCDMSGAGVATITESCNLARIFGQKNINNNLNSGSYLIDFDGNGGNAASNQYCDMTPTAWNNSEGGYTLVGVFRSNSTIAPSANIADISQENIYLNDATYQTLLSKSSEVILRSNRGDSSEVVMKLYTNVIPTLNCYKNDLSIVPSPYTGNSAFSTSTNMYWFWAESGCTFSGGDYTTPGIFDSTHYVMFSMSSYYLYLYDWSQSQFFINHGDTPAGGGSYSVPTKDPSESIYIFLK